MYYLDVGNVICLGNLNVVGNFSHSKIHLTLEETLSITDALYTENRN